MAVRILWDKYETALLIDTCLQIMEGQVSRKDAIAKLSRQLRKRAVDNGIEIDEIFRNENGIALQLSNMERILQRKPDAEKHNTKIFVDMVDLYFNDRKQFEDVLSEAKGVSQPMQSNQEAFLEWLSPRVSATQLSDCYVVVPEIEDFAKRKRIFTGPLFDVKDSTITGKLVNAINADKFFRFTHKRQINSIISTATYYHRYIKEMANWRNEEEVKTSPSTDSQVSIRIVSTHLNESSENKASRESEVQQTSEPTINNDSAEDNTEKIATSKELAIESRPLTYDSNTAKLTVNFQEDEDYTFTKPISMSYFGDKSYDSSWRKLYVRACKHLIADYPQVFRNLKGQSAPGDRRSLVYGVEAVDRLIAPIKIEKGYYVETNRNTPNIIRNIKQLLDACSVDYENLVITYVKGKKDDEHENQQMEQQRKTAMEAENHTGGNAQDTKVYQENQFPEATNRANFTRWLESKGFHEATCRSYTSGVLRVEEFGKANGLIDQLLYEINSFEELSGIWKKIQYYPPFAKYNLEQHHRLSAAMAKYLEFMNETQEGSESKPQQIVMPEVSIIKPQPQNMTSRSNLDMSSGLHPGRVEFKQWLQETKCPEGSIKTYLTAIDDLEQFVSVHNLEDRSLFAIRGVTRLEGLRESLRENSLYNQEFSQEEAHLQLYALKKYIAFRRNGTNVSVDEETSERFGKVLKDFFTNGFRPSSLIDHNRFRQYYEDYFDEELKMTDAEINNILSRLGATQDERIFFHDGNAAADYLDDILAELASTFRKGASCIFYSELYAKHQYTLASQLRIYNQEAMRDLLISNCYGAYRSRKNYFCLPDRAPDTDKDIISFMHQASVPLNYEEIHAQLWYISIEAIKHCLILTTDIVNVAQETYFYAFNLPVSTEELEDISEMLHRTFGQKNFITDCEMRDLINKYFPSIAINTEQFTIWGLRNCLAVLLKDRFSFNGAIISEIGQDLNMDQVFKEFSLSHDMMTLDDLKTFAKEVNNNIIYWESVMEVMVRISESEFVPKGQLLFDVDAIDKILDEMTEGPYQPIRNYRLFLQYPPLSVSWNTFVLESFVAGYSKRFKLMHASYGISDCCGAIVRRDSGIQEFQDIVQDVLVRSSNWNTVDEALSLLVNNGYLQRKKYGRINEIVSEAKLIRDRKAEGR